jgi:hypothetical protein
MKKQILLIVIAITALAPACRAQNYFINVELKRSEAFASISFRVPKEMNIKYYVLETSNDSINFEVVSRLKASGNSVTGNQYCIPAPPCEAKYYRIRQLDMNNTSQLSGVIRNEPAQHIAGL